MNTSIFELEKQISAIFRTKENQQKYEKLIAERQDLISNQTGDEQENLRREIEEIKNRQSNVGQRRYQLLQAISDKAEIVRQFQPEFEKAQRELDAANLDLSFFERGVSSDRMRLYDLTKKLNELKGGKNDDESIN